MSSFGLRELLGLCLLRPEESCTQQQQQHFLQQLDMQEEAGELSGMMDLFTSSLSSSSPPTPAAADNKEELC
jgi:hypothetical protein